MPPKPETLNTRVTRLERAMVELATAEKRLDNALAHLAEVQAQDQTEARERGRLIDQRIENLLKVLGQDRTVAEEREKRLDERIEKLVLAIAELVRRNGAK